MPECHPTSPTQREFTALRLITHLYRAAMDRSQWNRFAAELSDGLGGAPVTLAVRRPEARLGWDYFGAGSRDLAILVAADLQGALAGAVQRVGTFRRAFVDLGAAFPRVVLERHAWFQEQLAPRGVAPTWPLAHAVAVDDTIQAWLLVAPPADGPFDPDHIVALGALLVPHLSRALGMARDLGARSHKQRALEEVLDRLSLGFVLIDAQRRVIHANLSAQRILALEDGVALRSGELSASGGDDEALQAAVGAALDAAARNEFEFSTRTTVASRSGRRPYLITLAPLLSALPGSQVHDAVVLAILANPDALSTASVQALEAVYGLTAAEAAVVRGLVEGRSLEEIAAERRVRPDTARSQLKQVFAKTRTSRQAELIRLVLTGVAPLSHPADSEREPA